MSDIQTYQFLKKFGRRLYNNELYKDLRIRVETGNISENIAKEFEYLRGQKGILTKEEIFCQFCFLFANYCIKDEKILPEILEFNLNKEPKNSIVFYNSLKSYKDYIKILYKKNPNHLIDKVKTDFKYYPEDKSAIAANEALKEAIKNAEATKSIACNAVFPKIHNLQKLDDLYSYLKKERLIMNGTNYNNFISVFGFEMNNRIKRINWTGEMKSLNELISILYPNLYSKWQITCNTFLFNDFPIKKHSLSTAFSSSDTHSIYHANFISILKDTKY